MRPTLILILALTLLAVVETQEGQQQQQAAVNIEGEPAINAQEPLHTGMPAQIQQNVENNQSIGQGSQNQGDEQPSGHHSPGMAAHTLSKQQQQKMLEEEAMRVSFENSGEDTFAKYSNLTTEQLMQLQRKMHQQAQMAYDSAMKQMEQRQKKQEQEMQKLLKQQNLSDTQQISFKENEEFKQRQNIFNPKLFQPNKQRFYRHTFNEYMFQLQLGEVTDFSISLPIKQTVALYAQTYSNQEGVYSRTIDVGANPPPYIQILQQDRFLIKNESFYFKKYIIFEGKENTTYSIRFNNPGDPRLFALSVVQLLQHNHIAHTISANDIANHGRRAEQFYESLKSHVEHSHGLGLLEVSNTNRLNKGISHYYLYTLGQLVVVIMACVLQIKMVEKLLENGSVV